jgi:hypothetical protein
MADQDKRDVTERYDETTGDEGGGITNRPLEEEIENQESLPERGQTKNENRPGAREDEDRRSVQ